MNGSPSETSSGSSEIVPILLAKTDEFGDWDLGAAGKPTPHPQPDAENQAPCSDDQQTSALLRQSCGSSNLTPAFHMPAILSPASFEGATMKGLAESAMKSARAPGSITPILPSDGITSEARPV